MHWASFSFHKKYFKKSKIGVGCHERVFHFTKNILKKAKSGLNALGEFFISQKIF